MKTGGDRPRRRLLEGTRSWGPFALGVLAFAVFAIGAAPGPYWLDSQEIGAAGVRLGVADPSGFPLACFVARIASLLPFGELAFRVHLVSALGGAVAVGLVARLVLDALGASGVSVVAATAAALLLAGSSTFQRQAVVTEVYTPSGALLCAGLVLALRVARSPASGPGLSLALLVGLVAGGVHVSAALLLVPPLLVLLVWRLRRGARWTLVAPVLAVLGFVGTAVYLPLRSASGHVAAVDWGHPATFAGLLDHLRATSVRQTFADQMFVTVPEVLGDHLRTFGRLVEGDLGVVALLAAAGGIVALAFRPRGRPAALLLGVVAAGDLALTLLVNPMGITERQNGVPLAIAIAALAGAGIAAAGRRFGRAGPYAAGVLGFIALVPALLGGLGDKVAVASSEAPRRWSEAALAACGPRGIALVRTDSTAAGLLWLTAIEGARPDVAVLVRQHLVDLRRDRAVLAATGVRIAPRSASEALAAITASARPVCWEPGLDAPPAGSALIAGAVLGPIVPAAGAVPVASGLPDAVSALGRVFGGRGGTDEMGRRTFAGALGALGSLVLAEDRAAAVRLNHAALAVNPSDATALVNLGAIASRAGDLAGAAEATDRALALRPNNPTALVNAARYQLALAHDEAALRHASRAVKVAPRHAPAWALLGIAEARAGRFDVASRHLERALELEPDLAEARENLAKVRARARPR